MMVRRARQAAALLLAAAGVTLTAVTMLAAFAVYGRAVADAGMHGALASATAAETSILVHGAAGSDPAALPAWDDALRRTFGGGLGGVPVTISGAGYGAGWAIAEFPGPDGSGVAYAGVMHLDDLPGHAVLAAGQWPAKGGTPVRAALAEPAARLLDRGPGDRLRLVDRRSGQVTEVVISGVWRPRDAADPYWRLTPGVDTGAAAQSATYGPLVVDRADFAARFAVSGSTAWLVSPHLAGATLDRVKRVAAAATAVGTGLPAPRGLQQSATADTDLPELAARLTRADLVGRSALVTPMLLIVVLAGYCLLLMAGLLAEHRRGETALLRARGASRAQLTGLAAREALLVALPAAVLGPPAGVALVELAGRSPVLSGVGGLAPRLDGLTWTVAGTAAAACVVAMIAPAARRGRTYAAELAASSRPRIKTVVSRAGLDVVIVALAVLAWTQLRQYGSPLSAAGSGGAVGIDPLLAAAPTLGVIAGAVLTLRLLAPAARLAARLAGRLSGSAALLGTWQAGRRPRSGPTVLVALAVAAGTVSWCVAGTSQRSATDQADLRAGADLRLVETAGAAPADRAAQLAAAPGVTVALPGWRATVGIGEAGASANLVAVDVSAGVLRLREDVAGGDPEDLWRALTAHRPAGADTVLPPGRLTGVVRSSTPGTRTTALFTVPRGGHIRVPVEPDATGRFALAPPADPARLAGFLVSAPAAPAASTMDWRLERLSVPLIAPAWQVADRQTTTPAVRPEPRGLAATYRVQRFGPPDFAVVPAVPAGPVPVAATPAALNGLRLRVGQSTTVSYAGVPVDVTIVRTVAALPGTGEAAALLADLPSLSASLLTTRGLAPPEQEWWLSVRPEQYPAAAAAAATIAGVRVVDRRALAASLGSDPFGLGARAALFAAALAALLLAAVGVAVDVQATDRRRAGELAVLHALGAGPALLTRSLLTEQALLAGLGAVTGLVAGVLVAAAMAPLLVLTPAAARPVPVPLLVVDWPRAAGTGVLLVLSALALTVVAAAGRRRRGAPVRIAPEALPSATREQATAGDR